tara:strand:+ start:235 stop:432 length:198 start_codon:yes stop_codon:yes gene_type:complete
MSTIVGISVPSLRHPVASLRALLGWLGRRRQARRRRRATISLIEGSPHLLRDIGMADHHVPGRRP